MSVAGLRAVAAMTEQYPRQPLSRRRPKSAHETRDTRNGHSRWPDPCRDQPRRHRAGRESRPRCRGPCRRRRSDPRAYRQRPGRVRTADARRGKRPHRSELGNVRAWPSACLVRGGPAWAAVGHRHPIRGQAPLPGHEQHPGSGVSRGRRARLPRGRLPSQLPKQRAALHNHVREDPGDRWRHLRPAQPPRHASRVACCRSQRKPVGV